MQSMQMMPAVRLRRAAWYSRLVALSNHSRCKLCQALRHLYYLTVKCKIMTSILKKMNEDVAGIDIGSRHFFVGVDSEDGKGEVKNFETYTQGCYELLS